MDILIAGGGIGGLATALALSRNGHRVRVFDDRPAQATDVGAGIQLSPNATRILSAWGLGEAVDAAAFHPQRISMRDGKSRRRLMSLPLGETLRARHGFPYLHIHRGDMRQILHDAVVVQCGDVVRPALRAIGLSQAEGRPRLHFADGSHAEGDVVIGADGLRSAIREVLFGADRPRFTGYVAWRGLADAAHAGKLGLEPEVASFMAPGAHVVTYFVRGGHAVNFVGVFERSEPPGESWENEGARASLARDMLPFHDDLRELSRLIARPLLWPLFDRAPLPRWSVGCATLLGDACHPMLPFLAQGACMAMEDAAVLARCLENVVGPGAIAKALLRYEAARKARTARVQAEARAQGRFFHQAKSPARALTRTIMGLGSRLAPNLALSRYDWLWSHDALTAPLPNEGHGSSGRPAG